MKLSNLKPAKGSVKKAKRLGRGTGSGRGGTSTRGHKGAKSRSGYKSKRHFEGGQMPIQQRLPKRGFKNVSPRYKSTRAVNVVLNLSKLQAIAEKYNLTTITQQTLFDLGLVGRNDQYKVLGDGEVTSAFEVCAHRFSKSAKEAIEKAGGKALYQFKTNQLQGIAIEGELSKVGPKEVAKYFTHFGESDKLYVVAEGSLSTKFSLEAHKVDDEAISLIEGLGATVTVLG